MRHYEISYNSFDTKRIKEYTYVKHSNYVG